MSKNAFHQHPVLWGFLAAALTIGAGAETVQLTSWNLQTAQGTPAGTSEISAATRLLRTLDADVLLLQGISDWQTCAALAQGLKPANYNVLVCSSFGARQGGATRPQVAILAKPKAYFSWSEPWELPAGEPGGFAFAAVEIGQQRVGFFSSLLGAAAIPGPAFGQLSRQLDSVRNWDMNRVQTFVLGTTLASGTQARPGPRMEMLRLLNQAGFVEAVQGSLPGQKAARARSEPASGCLFVEPTTFAIGVARPSSVEFAHQPVSYELELDPMKAATAWASRAERRAPSEAEQPNEPGALGGEPTGTGARGPRLPWWSAGILGAALAFGVSVWLFRRRKAPPLPVSPALLGITTDMAGSASSSYTVVLAPHSATGAGSERPPAGAASYPVVRLEALGTTQTQSAAWRQRALAAERQAEQAQALLRKGLLPHLQQWLKHVFLRKLVADRAQLLQGQEEAARKARAVDERLTKIEQQIQQKYRAYEQRIEELNRELAAAKEENRELIRARIAQVRSEMEAVRAKALAEASEETEQGD